jgi:hypothetical protein
VPRNGETLCICTHIYKLIYICMYTHLFVFIAYNLCIYVFVYIYVNKMWFYIHILHIHTKYTILVTTMERCAKEWRNANYKGRLENQVFMQIRYVFTYVFYTHLYTYVYRNVCINLYKYTYMGD